MVSLVGDLGDLKLMLKPPASAEMPSGPILIGDFNLNTFRSETRPDRTKDGKVNSGKRVTCFFFRSVMKLLGTHFLPASSVAVVSVEGGVGFVSSTTGFVELVSDAASGFSPLHAASLWNLLIHFR